MNMKSIQTKLTVVILIIFFIALSALGGLNFWKARDIITENLARDMGNEANNAAEDVGVWLEGRIAQLTMLAAFLGAALRVMGGWLSDH